jgi:hypothetical protein
MRVTIGDRLGLKPKANKPEPKNHTSDDSEFVRMESNLPVVNLKAAPSSSFVPDNTPKQADDESVGPPRVRGEMVWLHKTAPTLVIQGKKGISAEEHAAGRRR